MTEKGKGVTRERLLDGAVEVFQLYGYPQATVDDICSAADLSRATFYIHFKSKADVVSALLERTRPAVKEYYSRLDGVLQSGSGSALRAWVRDALHYFEENQTPVLALDHVLSAGGKDAAHLLHPYTDYMRQLLTRWPEEEQLEARVRVWLLVHMIARVNLAWRVDGQMAEAGEDMIVDVLADLLAKGLQAPHEI